MDLSAKIKNLLTWKKGAKRAPHKPLLLLLSIGNIQRGGSRLQYFADIEVKLSRALQLFGPAGRVATPQYPFWRLQHDDIWELVADSEMIVRKSSDDPTKKALIDKNARAGFLEKYFEFLRDNRALQTITIHQLLDGHFPSSIQEDIIAFFDLEIDVPRATETLPQGEFREGVLKAYDWKCAISEFSLKFQGAVFGVEPSLIRWPQAGGVTCTRNAIALTTLHRKLFHLGVFTVDEDYKIRVSQQAIGQITPSAELVRLERKKIFLPESENDWPDKSALAWHMSEVFRG